VVLAMACRVNSWHHKCMDTRPQPLTVGESAPWFHLPTGKKPRYSFDTAAGRYVLLVFFGSSTEPQAREVLQRLARLRSEFDDERVSFFGITTDRADVTQERVRDAPPGVRFFHDLEGQVSALYGAHPPGGAYRPVSYLLDPALRVLHTLVWAGQPAEHVAQLASLLAAVPAPQPPHAASPQAPVLVVPRVFPPELCTTLINYYQQHGGVDSGFMRDINGQTTTVIDHGFKRRGDRMIDDPQLQRRCVAALHERLLPEIYKAFQFQASHLERALISCYDAQDSGHFAAHRDNTTLATRHRRFAVSLFLNSGQYEGGQLQFPEFGSALYSAPAGGAVVFSCSLLHKATAVTRGQRYMFLPFLYDSAAQALRQANAQHLSDQVIHLA
jgi:peroxiredoxin/predicted 2-oxoglutarate/Fe(II)-dependent dioxygenase YbiX